MCRLCPSLAQGGCGCLSCWRWWKVSGVGGMWVWHAGNSSCALWVGQGIPRSCCQPKKSWWPLPASLSHLRLSWLSACGGTPALIRPSRLCPAGLGPFPLSLRVGVTQGAGHTAKCRQGRGLALRGSQRGGRERGARQRSFPRSLEPAPLLLGRQPKAFCRKR